ncbi:MAG: alcohol dehydrogenase catalytic domain-containing protein, partial [Acidobacteriota bacterium]
MEPHAWRMTAPESPLKRSFLAVPEPGQGEVLLEVLACGICHTDLGFLSGSVRTRSSLPLTLGHEILGKVVQCGLPSRVEAGGRIQTGALVLVPAVLPCGGCRICRSGRENICPTQKMPGNDLHGGFSTHVLVPARFLVPVEAPSGRRQLLSLAVVADAVTTPYQALSRSGLLAGDQVVVIGTGGIGLYAVQLSCALGARVIAVDVVSSRAKRCLALGAEKSVATAGLGPEEARAAVRQEAEALGWRPHGWKVFEMSGSASGQELAFSLLTPAGTLGVVGYTRAKIRLCLSRLMAL